MAFPVVPITVLLVVVVDVVTGAETGLPASHLHRLELHGHH